MFTRVAKQPVKESASPSVAKRQDRAPHTDHAQQQDRLGGKLEAGGPHTGPQWSFCELPLFASGKERSSPSLPLQRKLAVGATNDPLEQETDRVAEQVMRMPAPEVASSFPVPQISGKCSACEVEEQEELQKKQMRTSEAAPAEAPASIYEVLRSPGQPLDDETRAFFESRFGYNFRNVRVHADAKAAVSARDVNALAYTAGQHVVFGVGAYAPNTDAGRKLLAHELTHTVHQSSPCSDRGSSKGMLQRSPDGKQKMPWYQQYQLEVLDKRIQGWAEYEKSLARFLLLQWFVLRNGGVDDKTVWTQLQTQVVLQYVLWLVALDQATQKYCHEHGLTIEEKLGGASCDPLFGGYRNLGEFKVNSFRGRLKLTSSPDEAPLTNVHWWVLQYRNETNPEVLKQAAFIQSVLTGVAFGVGRSPPSPAPKQLPPRPAAPTSGAEPVPTGAPPPVRAPARDPEVAKGESTPRPPPAAKPPSTAVKQSEREESAAPQKVMAPAKGKGSQRKTGKEEKEPEGAKGEAPKTEAPASQQKVTGAAKGRAEYRPFPSKVPGRRPDIGVLEITSDGSVSIVVANREDVQAVTGANTHIALANAPEGLGTMTAGAKRYRLYLENGSVTNVQPLSKAEQTPELVDAIKRALQRNRLISPKGTRIDLSEGKPVESLKSLIVPR